MANIIGDVPFPYTIKGKGAGFGKIVTSRTSLPSANYVVIAQGTQNGDGWNIDSMLTEDAESRSSVFSALNAKWGGRTVYVTLFIDRELDSLHGSSCGAAAFLSLLGIRTTVAITGWMQSFGLASVSFPIFPVDSVDAKILFALEKGKKLIVPAKAHSAMAAQLMREKKITTYAGMITNEGPDVYTIGSVEGLSDLAFVLSAMDRENVTIQQFVPPHSEAFTLV